MTRSAVGTWAREVHAACEMRVMHLGVNSTRCPILMFTVEPVSSSVQSEASDCGSLKFN